MSTRELQAFFKTPTARLSGSYLIIIMLMSIGFSIVFYNASSHELGRQVPPPSSFGIRHYDDYRGPGPRINDFFQKRISEGRHTLLERLVLVNALTLVFGGFISYSLARRTLEPIEVNMEAQNQFVSDASHELRTPLTVLQTTNEVALRKRTISNAEAKELLAHNVSEVAKLQLLTDSLLKLAKADGEKQSLVATPLASLITDALNTVMPAALAKKISVADTILPATVMASPPALTQAIVTVLDNAIKYSPAKSTIYVDAKKQGKLALLSIRDEGPGIAAEHLPHIFDRFYRADAARNKQNTDGFGIGLALARKIAEQHHADLIATSQPGRGTVFTFKLPLS